MLAYMNEIKNLGKKKTLMHTQVRACKFIHRSIPKWSSQHQISLVMRVLIPLSSVSSLHSINGMACTVYL